jgi:GntR family transcriptional regulator, transcriptional repressor for pyruvate dehydrogenase complex
LFFSEYDIRQSDVIHSHGNRKNLPGELKVQKAFSQAKTKVMNILNSIQPIKKSTLADEIIQSIQDLIRNETLKAGDRLPTEIELGEKFRVGRSTIREALRALASLGMIDRSKRGTFISHKITKEEEENSIIFRSRILKDCALTDLLEWRSILEGEICVLAAQRATDEDISQLGAALKEMERAIDNNMVSTFVQADASFHLALAEAAHNQVADRMLKLIREEVVEEIGETLSRDHKLLKRAMKSHSLIFQAIVNEEAEQSKDLMMHHLQDVKRVVERGKFNRKNNEREDHV